MEKFKIAQAVIDNKEKITNIEFQLFSYGFYKSRTSGLMINDYIQFQYNFLADNNTCLNAYISCSLNGDVEWAINGFTDDSDEITEELINHCIIDYKNKHHKITKKVKNKSGYLYLMRNLRNGYTKIGVSNNPEYRENTLQSKEPEVELIWKKKLNDAYCKEKELHELYSEKRIRGEWFMLSEHDIIQIINPSQKLTTISKN